MKILVTGGCGFLGSHIVDRLVEQGHDVTALDLFAKNVNPRCGVVVQDVCEPINVEPVDQIYHMACHASPQRYKLDPVGTAKTCFIGTLNVLEFARVTGARVLLASTSEIYGEPLEHPQRETYRGNVNTLGPRACYDEGKRIAETLCMDYSRVHGTDIRIARIFNTYGPRMDIDDGRVVSTFVDQATMGRPLTIYGDGSQTRSFQYVSDCVEGLVRVMNGNNQGPFNIGNPDEITVLELAEKIIACTDSDSHIIHLPLTQDDPSRRKPDISRARELLGWSPKVNIDEGIIMTLNSSDDRS